MNNDHLNRKKTISFSLDIEGTELLVLKTLPWDKLDIEVLTVETAHAGEVFPGTTEDIRQFLRDRGYVLVYTIAGLIFSERFFITGCFFFTGLDDVFVRQDLFEGKYAPDLQEQKLFELEMNGNQRWDVGSQLKSDREDIKDEL